MKAIRIALVMCVVAVLFLGIGTGISVDRVKEEEAISTTTTESTSTTVVTTTVETTEAISTTTESAEPPVYGSPVSFEIPSQGVVAPIDEWNAELANSCGQKNNPCPGIIDWLHDERRVSPCENGLVFLTGHLNPGEPLENLIDDAEYDNDSHILVGDQVIIRLEDGGQCIYQVVEPVGLPGERIPDQPATFIPKLEFSTYDGGWLEELTAFAGEKPTLVISTSFAGIDEYRLIPGTRHRYYAALVLAELVSIVPSTEDTPQS